jgi:hypothetical protein
MQDFSLTIEPSSSTADELHLALKRPHRLMAGRGSPVMAKTLFSLIFAAAVLGLASSEASANSFVCQAVGPRSVGYGRAHARTRTRARGSCLANLLSF